MSDKIQLCFDIGYNVGDFTKKCLEEHPECEVVGVEANFNLFQHHTQHKNVKVLHRLASSESDTQTNFFLEPNQSGISTASQAFMDNSRFAKGSKNLPPKSGWWSPTAIKVKSITLDDMIEDYGDPDLIKIDVEGMEKEVLEGAQSIILQHRPYLFVENDRKEKSKELVAYIREMGYLPYWVTTALFNKDNYFEKKEN